MARRPTRPGLFRIRNLSAAPPAASPARGAARPARHRARRVPRPASSAPGPHDRAAGPSPFVAPSPRGPTVSTPKPIAIYHEHPDWFRPLFAELERRGIPYVRLDAAAHRYDPPSGESPVLARVQPREPVGVPARPRAGHVLHAALAAPPRAPRRAGRERQRARTRYELSKATQLDAARTRSGCPTRAPRVINHPSQARGRGRRTCAIPVLVKANIGGSGAGIMRYDSAATRCERAVDDGPARPRRRRHGAGAGVRRRCAAGTSRASRRSAASSCTRSTSIPPAASFNLCPADACQTTDGVELVRAACAIDAPKTGCASRATRRRRRSSPQVERIAQAAGIDVGGIEYLVDDRDGRHYFYDVNALSNFVADAPNVVGFDPFARLVDYLEARAPAAASARARDAADATRREALRRGRRVARCASATGCRCSAAGCATSTTRAWTRRWAYVQRLARRSEEIGYDLTLIAELFLNDIKGDDAPSLDAWSTAAALAAVTERLELMVAVRPTFHQPGDARQAGGEHRPASAAGGSSLNVVSRVVGRRGAALRRPLRRSTTTATRAPPSGSTWSTAPGASRRLTLSAASYYHGRRPRSLEPKPRRAGRGRRSTPAASREAAKTPHRAHAATPTSCTATRRSAWRRRSPTCAARRERARPARRCSTAWRPTSIVRDTEAEAQRELARITNVAAGLAGLPQLPGLARQHAARAARVARGLLGVATAGCAPGLVGTPEQVADRVRGVRGGRRRTCCCCSAARSSRRWSGSPSR